MTRYALPPPPQPSVAVQDSDLRFAVRRIFCVGRNYADHVREMGNDPGKSRPVFFTKPADALVPDGAVIDYPPATADFHHEAELIVAIGVGGSDIAADAALHHIWGYGAGNDLTRRDLQARAKESRSPWDMAKGFDHSAVCGPLRPSSGADHPVNGRIRLTVNDAVRQQADIAQMIWTVPQLIAELSVLVTLAPGDLIFTGTPAGVGPLARGDVCRVEIDRVGSVTTTIR